MNDKYAVLDACYVNAVKLADDGQQALLEQAIGEAESAPRPAPDMLTAALWYASMGLHVFPLSAGEKRPLPKSNGFKDATTDPHTIQPWFWNGTTRNLGVATGGRYDVIDIDGQQGSESFIELMKDAAPWLIIRAVCETPRGLHLWVPAEGGGNEANWVPGVDFRGLGGYVVVPPSQLYGVSTGYYRWLLPPIV